MDTPANWLRTTMKDAGINTKQFSPHSIRSASATKAKSLGFDEDIILKAAN
ncbi:hypothetical protein IWQ61_006319 [Dispira simplex]|nr:hypothetical protein IWQ61_006319 [Dispira simplex]